MLNGSFTWQMVKRYYGDKGYVNPNNMWALEGRMHGFDMGGGSGKVSVPMFCRWLVKLSGLYQFPLRFNASFTLIGREGHFITESFVIADTTLVNPRSQSAPIFMIYWDQRSTTPNVWILNLRLEKAVRYGDRGQMIYFSADVFNARNKNTLLRQYALDYGTYYVNYGCYVPPAPTSGIPTEVLNPRVVRFGVRFQF